MDLGKQAVWRMREADGAQWIPASVPGCIFSDLMAAGKLPDPYYRDQEELAKEASLKDYVYEGRFALTREQLQSDALMLIFHGLDTLCDVLINDTTGQLLALIVPGPCRFFGLLGREDDFVIPWECIRRIGDDIIIVEISGECCREKRPKRPWF